MSGKICNGAPTTSQSLVNETRAYCEGRKWAADGGLSTGNPHESGNEDALAWARGYASWKASPVGAGQDCCADAYGGAGMQLQIETTGEDEDFTILAADVGTYNATIDWGDGSALSVISAYNDADLAHTYAAAGVYEIVINGSFPRINFNNGGDVAKIQGIVLRDIGTLSFQNSFYGAANNVSVSGGPITSGVENFTSAWRDNGLTSFPGTIDISSGTNFTQTWRGNGLTSFPSTLDFSSAVIVYAAWYDNALTSFPAIDFPLATDFGFAWRANALTSFPDIDLSSGESFTYAWYGNQLTAFPAIDLSSGTDFSYAWYGNPLTTFPAGMFDSCVATDYTNAFFGCALDETGVDNILVSVDTSGAENGTLDLDGGTNAAPGVAGAAAKLSLEGKGWTVTTN